MHSGFMVVHIMCAKTWWCVF